MNILDNFYFCWLESSASVSRLQHEIRKLKKKEFGFLPDEKRLELLFCILKNNSDIFSDLLSARDIMYVAFSCKTTLFLTQVAEEVKNKKPFWTYYLLFIDQLIEHNLAYLSESKPLQVWEKIENLERRLKQQLERKRRENEEEQISKLMKLKSLDCKRGRKNFHQKKKNNRKNFRKQNNLCRRFHTPRIKYQHK